ncbi:hypothetical protein [Kiloniella spongiae]|uniref:hypothetical protein n=1 Tax=Kiloniella spongiae TaxID=1489064 RepID=UPI0012E0AE18|nr:hypothetical protein [Kiloniella spongiae]
MKKDAPSYISGYSNAFKRSTLFDVTVVNVETHNPLSERFNRWSALAGRKFDAVILLHSIFSSALKLPPRWRDALRSLRSPIVYFIANEYYRMPEKMKFAQELNVSLLVSQCFSERVLDLYRNRLGCMAIGLPNTGFDKKCFSPGGAISERPIDIGYRMVPGHPSFGHWEREDIAVAVEKAAEGRYITDISLKIEDRFGLAGWGRFLQNSKTQLAVASGGNIFELDDKTLMRTSDLIKSHPRATREEIAAVYPPKSEWIPLRTLSSRIIEAAATKTPQIMYHEKLGTSFEPDIDFIALHKDHSNLSDVMDRVTDYPFLELVANNCFKKLKDHMSYDRIFTKLDTALKALS